MSHLNMRASNKTALVIAQIRAVVWRDRIFPPQVVLLSELGIAKAFLPGISAILPKASVKNPPVLADH